MNDKDQLILEKKMNKKLKAKITDLERTNSALEVLVDAKVAKIAEWKESREKLLVRFQEKEEKIAELEAKDKGRMEEIAELDLEIAELEDITIPSLKRAIDNIIKEMQSCAVELQAWNSSGVLNHIIWKLEGRSED